MTAEVQEVAMASLLEKIQTLVSADLNRLLDRGISSTNEEAMYQHHIRELQSLQEQLGSQLVSLRAELNQMRKRSDEQQALVAKQDAEVDQLLQAGLQEDALAAQDRLNANRLAAATAAERVERLESEYAQMEEAKKALDSRIQTLVANEPAVRSMMGLARAKQLTAAARQSLDDLEGSGDPDAERVVGAIRTRLAEAEAQLEQLEQRGLARGETPEVLKRKELEAQLEARKARLGL
jgi:phage shock protein A